MTIKSKWTGLRAEQNASHSLTGRERNKAHAAYIAEIYIPSDDYLTGFNDGYSAACDDAPPFWHSIAIGAVLGSMFTSAAFGTAVIFL